MRTPKCSIDNSVNISQWRYCSPVWYPRLDELYTGQHRNFSFLCYLLYHLSLLWINFKTAILGTCENKGSSMSILAWETGKNPILAAAYVESNADLGLNFDIGIITQRHQLFLHCELQQTFSTDKFSCHSCFLT